MTKCNQMNGKISLPLVDKEKLGKQNLTLFSVIVGK